MTAHCRSRKPVFESKVITSATPGHAVDVDADITGARSCTWSSPTAATASAATGPIGPSRGSSGRRREEAHRAEMEVAAPTGARSASTRTAEGEPLRINGKAVEYGIGTHANSRHRITICPKATRASRPAAGLDNGGTDQGGGKATSVQFAVYTEKPRCVAVAAGQPVRGRRDAAATSRQTPSPNLDVHEGLEATLFASEPMLLNPIEHRHRPPRPRLGLRSRQLPRPQRQAARRRPHPDPRRHRRRRQGRQGQRSSTKAATSTRRSASACSARQEHEGHRLGRRQRLRLHRRQRRRQGRQARRCSSPASAARSTTTASMRSCSGPTASSTSTSATAASRSRTRTASRSSTWPATRSIDDRKPYQQGMVFRCNLDGSEVRNARLELPQQLGSRRRFASARCGSATTTTTATGRADQLRDGVRQLRLQRRIHRRRLAARSARISEAEIPLRHWHLNDPGVVPNLLHTGAGSPTGICVYEGDAAAEVFRNQ